MAILVSKAKVRCRAGIVARRVRFLLLLGAFENFFAATAPLFAFGRGGRLGRIARHLLGLRNRAEVGASALVSAPFRLSRAVKELELFRRKQVVASLQPLADARRKCWRARERLEQAIRAPADASELIQRDLIKPSCERPVVTACLDDAVESLSGQHAGTASYGFLDRVDESVGLQ